MLIVFCRRFGSLHKMDYTYQQQEALYHTNVPLPPTSETGEHPFPDVDSYT